MATPYIVTNTNRSTSKCDIVHNSCNSHVLPNPDRIGFSEEMANTSRPDGVKSWGGPLDDQRSSAQAERDQREALAHFAPEGNEWK